MKARCEQNVRQGDEAKKTDLLNLAADIDRDTRVTELREGGCVAVVLPCNVASLATAARRASSRRRHLQAIGKASSQVSFLRNQSKCNRSRRRTKTVARVEAARERTKVARANIFSFSSYVVV